MTSSDPVHTFCYQSSFFASSSQRIRGRDAEYGRQRF
jgi:hypothetical protein